MRQVIPEVTLLPNDPLTLSVTRSPLSEGDALRARERDLPDTAARADNRAVVAPISSELIDALTATAVYLEACRRLVDRSDPIDLDKIRSAIENAQSGAARASIAAKRLRDLA